MPAMGTSPIAPSTSGGPPLNAGCTSCVTGGPRAMAGRRAGQAGAVGLLGAPWEGSAAPGPVPAAALRPPQHQLEQEQEQQQHQHQQQQQCSGLNSKSSFCQRHDLIAPLPTVLDVCIVRPVIRQYHLVTRACWGVLLHQCGLLEHCRWLHTYFFQVAGDWAQALAAGVDAALRQQQLHLEGQLQPQRQVYTQTRQPQAAHLQGTAQELGGRVVSAEQPPISERLSACLLQASLQRSTRAGDARASALQFQVWPAQALRRALLEC
jgi:hypothetical protein